MNFLNVLCHLNDPWLRGEEKICRRIKVNFFIMKSIEQSANAISLQFSENGVFFAEAVKTLASYRLRIWETGSSNLICSTVGQDGDSLTCACWNHSTDQTSLCIALGLENGDILIFSVAQKKSVVTLKKHSAMINDFVFSKDGKSGYSCSEDGLVVEWDLKSNTVKR